MASSQDWQKKSDGNYKDEICEVTVQADETQSPVDLPAEVLPMLAATGVMQNSNGKIQLCEPSLQQETKKPAGIMVVTSEIGDTFIPASASQELKNGPDVSRDQTPKEEVTAAGDAKEGQICKVPVNSIEPDVAKGQCNIEEEVQTSSSVGLLPLKGAEETSLDNEENQPETSLEMLQSNDWDISPEHEQLLDVTQGATSQTEELEPRVDLQRLPADVLPMLAAMGVIQYSNGQIQLCEPSLQQKKETPAGIMEVTSEKSDTFIPDVTCEDASASQERKNAPDASLDQTPKGDQTLSVGLLPLKGPEETSLDNEENQAENNGIAENTLAVCEVCNMSSAELMMRPEALFLIPALVQKVFKMAGSDNYRGHTFIIVTLHRKISEQLIVDGQRKIRVKDLDKIGKKAAKRLIMEYGSANAVLRALQEPDTAELEAAIVNHLNIQLRAFQNRPKSALARFSRVRRAFTFR